VSRYLGVLSEEKQIHPPHHTSCHPRTVLLHHRDSSGFFYYLPKLGNVFLPIARIRSSRTAQLPPVPDYPSARDQIPTETLKLLEGIVVPENNLATLACQFKNVCNIPPTVASPSEPYSVGVQQTFWVNDEDTNSYFQVHATLRYITPHSYFGLRITLTIISRILIT